MRRSSYTTSLSMSRRLFLGRLTEASADISSEFPTEGCSSMAVDTVSDKFRDSEFSDAPKDEDPP